MMLDRDPTNASSRFGVRSKDAPTYSIWMGVETSRKINTKRPNRPSIYEIVAFRVYLALNIGITLGEIEHPICFYNLIFS